MDSNHYGGSFIPTVGRIEVVNPRPAGYTDFASTLVNPHACWHVTWILH